MKFFKKAKSLEGFLIQLEAKISEEHEEQETECLLEKQNRNGSCAKKKGVDRNATSAKYAINKNRNANGANFMTNNSNVQADDRSLEEVATKKDDEVPAPGDVNWTNRKKLMVSLFALGVLGFLTFFLVGTMASLKWFSRSDEDDPLPVALGAHAVIEKYKFHPLASISANPTRNVTSLKSTTASTFQNYARISNTLPGPVKANATQIVSTVGSARNDSRRIDSAPEKITAKASLYQSAVTSSPFTFVNPSPALALAAIGPDDSSTQLSAKSVTGLAEVKPTNTISDSDGPLTKRYSLTEMNNDQLALLLQSMSSKTPSESSSKPLTELSNDPFAQPLQDIPSKTGGVASMKPLTAMSIDQLADLLESISSMSASTLKPKT